jgi:hypothetical protein
MLEPLSLQALADVRLLWSNEYLTEAVMHDQDKGITKDWELARQRYAAASIAYQKRKDETR